jgi:hypothetical protein
MQQAQIQAELTGLHSPDVYNLAKLRPDGPFGILVQAMVGPRDGDGEESFDFVLCTPEWFAANMKEGFIPGRPHLFVRMYSYPDLVKFLSDMCNSCHESSWSAVAEKIGRIGNRNLEITFHTGSRTKFIECCLRGGVRA